MQELVEKLQQIEIQLSELRDENDTLELSKLHLAVSSFITESGLRD